MQQCCRTNTLGSDLFDEEAQALGGLQGAVSADSQVCGPPFSLFLEQAIDGVGVAIAGIDTPTEGIGVASDSDQGGVLRVIAAPTQALSASVGANVHAEVGPKKRAVEVGSWLPTRSAVAVVKHRPRGVFFTETDAHEDFQEGPAEEQRARQQDPVAFRC